MRPRLRNAVLFLLPLVVVGVFLAWCNDFWGLYLLVPRTRDQRLFGYWNGMWAEKPCRYRFFTDGTGDIEGERHVSFAWGTRDGVLVARFFSIDAWVRIKEPYEVDSSGEAVTFAEQSPWSKFSGTLRRPTPEPKGPMAIDPM